MAGKPNKSPLLTCVFMREQDNVQKGPTWWEYSQFEGGGNVYNILQDGNKSSVHAFIPIFGLVVYFFPASWLFQIASKVVILSFPSTFEFCSLRCAVSQWSDTEKHEKN